MADDPRLVARAEAGELEAQRQLCTILAQRLPQAPDLDAALNELERFARLASAQGEYADQCKLAWVHGCRAGLHEGKDGEIVALAEAVALVDEAADDGHEDAGAALLRLADEFRSAVSADAFALASALRSGAEIERLRGES